MGASIVTNISALATHRALAQTDRAMGRSLERLASGFRINRAADDAAGLSISEGLRSQIGGMRQAVRNTQDGISVVQTAEGALEESSAMLRRMRDLAVQAGNDGALDADAKDAVQGEIDQLKAELTRVASTTQFNGRTLLDGSYDGLFQVGAQVGETILITIGRPGSGMGAAGLGVEPVDVTGGSTLPTTVIPAVSDEEGAPHNGQITFAGDFTSPGTFADNFSALTGTVSYAGKTFALDSVDYSGDTTVNDFLTSLNNAARNALAVSFIPFTATSSGLVLAGQTPGVGSTVADAANVTPGYTGRSGADGALRLIDRAIARVSSTRAGLGAAQNRLEHTIARLNVSIENTTAAESRIRDTDMAAEMTTFTRNQVMSQAGTAMLAQANQTPQTILKLLG